MKTGLSDIKLKNYITALLKSISFSKRFLKIFRLTVIYYEDMGFRIIQVEQLLYWITCKVELRHICCFSGVILIGGSGVNFCWVFAFRSFSQKLYWLRP